MPKVFDPIKIGQVELKNRMITEPMMSNSDIGGYVTDVMLDIYRERAAGGWGMVVVEASGILKNGRPFETPGLWDDEFIPGLTQLADAIHEGGSRACIQIIHAGRQANPEVTRTQNLAPSDNSPTWASRKVRAFTTKEVEEVIEAYAQAALRAKKAGFESIMYHGSHGFLPQQFMSPWSNPDRTDRFGGPTGFATELIRRTREVVGPEMALIMRMPAEEFRGDAGINLKLVVETITPALEKAGIDAIDLTTGNWHRFDAIIPPVYYQRATFVPYAEEVKKVVKIPVIGVGRINDPKLIDNLIEEGRVDLVGLARQAYADPDLPNKMLAGRYSEVRKCLACGACSGPRLPRNGVYCAINPTLQRSKLFPMTKVEKPKKVLVIGGGVAGMEAARVAAVRGHDVMLMEKGNRLGGQVNVSANIPRVYTRELDNYARQSEGWLKEAGVRVELGREATVDTVRELKPDYVLLATGSKSLVPDIPGADGPNVLTEEEGITSQSKVGKRVAILGASRGAEMAVSLANGGREVVILEAGGQGMVSNAPYMFGHRRLVIPRLVLQNPNIKFMAEVKVKEITASGVTYVDKSGAECRVEADTVILALGRVPNRELERAINGVPTVEEVIPIGDASRPINQLNAIHDGFFAAYGIGDPKGLERSRLLQIQRAAAEQTRIPAPGVGFEGAEWETAINLPHLVPGIEVRRAARLAAEEAADK